MPASTTRLALYKPGGGSTGTITPDEVADIDKLNANFDKIDAAAGASGYTSTTRPGSPFNGQLIYESDTRQMTRWDQGLGQWVLASSPATGTTVQRDARYPIPGTDAGKVAFAALGMEWFNTDKGWIEQYFAGTAMAGSGRFSRTAANWYPSVRNGRVPIRPTAVTLGAGTSAVLDGGAIVLTACSSFSFDGAFTTDFDTYEIELETSVTTGDATLQIQTRTAGTPDTGNNYIYSASYTSGSSAAPVGEGNSAGINVMVLGRVANGGGSMRFKVSNPATAGRTSFLGQSVDAAIYLRSFGGQAAGATPKLVDGLLCYFFSGLGTGTISVTGRMRIYGITDY